MWSDQFGVGVRVDSVQLGYVIDCRPQGPWRQLCPPFGYWYWTLALSNQRGHTVLVADVLGDWRR